MKLQDRVAVVTGASRGLGAYFSEALIERGAYVFGLARSKEALEKVRARLGERFFPVVCDVRKEDQVKEAFQEVFNRKGRVDVLINNAGLGRPGPVDKLSTEDWMVQVETNLNGVFFCTREAVPVMKKQHQEEGFGGHSFTLPM